MWINTFKSIQINYTSFAEFEKLIFPVPMQQTRPLANLPPCSSSITKVLMPASLLYSPKTAVRAPRLQEGEGKKKGNGGQ